MQSGKGGLAGAEVVDGDPNAGGAQVGQDVDDLVLVGHDGAFGDLEHEVPGGQTGQVQDREDLGGVAGLAELAEADVDSDLGRGCAAGLARAELGAPGGELPAGLLEDEVPRG